MEQNFYQPSMNLCKPNLMHEPDGLAETPKARPPESWGKP